MKILQVFNRYLQASGEESSVARIATHMEMGGHDVYRFWRSSKEWLDDKGPPRWKQACLIGNNRSVLDELRQAHDKFSPDVWVLHNVLPVISLGVYKLALELQVPIVQWLHNYRPLTLSGVQPSLQRGNYLREIAYGAWRGSRVQTLILALHYSVFYSFQRARAVYAWVPVSRRMHDIFRQHPGFDGRLYTIHHSWDIGPVVPENGQDGGSEPYFLFMGRLVEEKGVRFLTELFARKELSHCRLIIAGSGELEEELRSCSSSNVEWAGYVSGVEKKKLVRGSLAVLFPSIWDEPLSTIVYEAYEQERCVIASDRGGTPEVVVQGETGYVLEASNADLWCETLLGLTREEMNRAGDNGRRWLIENVGPESWNKEFKRVLDQVVSGGN